MLTARALPVLLPYTPTRRRAPGPLPRELPRWLLPNWLLWAPGYTQGSSPVCLSQSCVNQPFWSLPFQCSVTCGKGYKQRLVSCSEIYTGKENYEYSYQTTVHCPGIQPPRVQPCYLPECPVSATWRVGNWGSVSQCLCCVVISIDPVTGREGTGDPVLEQSTGSKATAGAGPGVHTSPGEVWGEPHNLSAPGSSSKNVHCGTQRFGHKGRLYTAEILPPVLKVLKIYCLIRIVQDEFLLLLWLKSPICSHLPVLEEHH